MKTGRTILTLAALILAAAPYAGAGSFSLNVLDASDIKLSAASRPVPGPAAEISVMEEAEASAYLADRETEVDEKGLAGEPEARNLGGDGIVRLYHQWHKESLEIRYRDEYGNYIPEAMQKIKHLFRDRLTGKEMAVPARLLEILDIIQERHGGRTITILCGYRSPELNAALAANSSTVARHSLHLKGWAADIMIDGVRTSALRDTAKSLKAGGVGYYPSDGFVHVDAGSVRYW